VLRFKERAHKCTGTKWTLKLTPEHCACTRFSLKQRLLYTLTCVNIQLRPTIEKKITSRLHKIIISCAVLVVISVIFHFSSGRNAPHADKAKIHQVIALPSDRDGSTYWGYQVIGTEKFQRQIQAALLLLTNKDPDDYAIFRKFFQRITESEHSGTWAYDNPATVYIAPKTAFRSLTWCASSLVHEAYHRKLYQDYLEAHGSPVPVEVYHGKEAEKICMQHQLVVLEKVGSSAYEKVWLKMQDGSHYTVPYSNQNW
jgi:hypothetical protein